jgi:heme/copper-type cytochrome/quinol oxidase subunit 4
MAMNFHEDLERSPLAQRSSDRNFGLVFAVFLTAVALWPLHAHRPIRWIPLGFGGVFLLAALIQPGILGPLNRVWSWIGLTMGKIMNPIVTGLAFFVVFTPVAFIARMMGKDPLRLKKDAAADSYWIARQPPGPEPSTMAKQF